MSSLFNTRKKLASLEEKVGIDQLNESVKQTYTFISVAPTTRAEMLRHPYFVNLSLSTIKRSVTELLQLELIAIKASHIDKRKKYLRIT
jgi:DNA-binding MarR family transcriptional regulator